MKSGLRMNTSSDLISAVQAYILATNTAFQEAPLMGTCHTIIPKEGKPKISKKMLLPLL